MSQKSQCTPAYVCGHGKNRVMKGHPKSRRNTEARTSMQLRRASYTPHEAAVDLALNAARCWARKDSFDSVKFFKKIKIKMPSSLGVGTLVHAVPPGRVATGMQDLLRGKVAAVRNALSPTRKRGTAHKWIIVRWTGGAPLVRMSQSGLVAVPEKDVAYCVAKCPCRK